MGRRGNDCTVLNTHHCFLPDLCCLNTAAFRCKSSWRETGPAASSCCSSSGMCSWEQAWQPGILVEPCANLSLWLKCCSWLCQRSCGLHRCNPQHLQCWHPRWSALPRSLQRTCAACCLAGVPDHFCTTRFWSLVCHWFYIQAELCPPASRTAKLQASWWTWEVLQNRRSMTTYLCTMWNLRCWARVLGGIRVLQQKNKIVTEVGYIPSQSFLWRKYRRWRKEGKDNN